MRDLTAQEREVMGRVMDPADVDTWAEAKYKNGGLDAALIDLAQRPVSHGDRVLRDLDARDFRALLVVLAGQFGLTLAQFKSLIRDAANG
jgi:hypothetical protein